MGKKTYHHGDLRSALLTAATDMITESGVDSVTMRGLAQRIGVSRTAPYRHFADKQTLLTAVAVEGYARLSKACAKVKIDYANDPVGALGAIGRTYVQFAVENPSHYKLMFGETGIRANESEEIRQAAREVSRTMVGVIREGQTIGRIVNEPPRKIANLLWSASHGLAMLLITGQLQSDPSEAARFMTDMMDGAMLINPA